MISSTSSPIEIANMQRLINARTKLNTYRSFDPEEDIEFCPLTTSNVHPPSLTSPRFNSSSLMKLLATVNSQQQGQQQIQQNSFRNGSQISSLSDLSDNKIRQNQLNSPQMNFNAQLASQQQTLNGIRRLALSQNQQQQVQQQQQQQVQQQNSSPKRGFNNYQNSPSGNLAVMQQNQNVSRQNGIQQQNPNQQYFNSFVNNPSQPQPQQSMMNSYNTQRANTNNYSDNQNIRW
ncbi:hypothetical protein B5S33_g2035 [[Candida] boidinii]|nr:hypothetical protein B5S33_g2035 [[Candida] boidinii]